MDQFINDADRDLNPVGWMDEGYPPVLVRIPDVQRSGITQGDVAEQRDLTPTAVASSPVAVPPDKAGRSASHSSSSRSSQTQQATTSPSLASKVAAAFFALLVLGLAFVTFRLPFTDEFREAPPTPSLEIIPRFDELGLNIPDVQLAPFSDLPHQPLVVEETKNKDQHKTVVVEEAPTISPPLSRPDGVKLGMPDLSNDPFVQDELLESSQTANAIDGSPHEERGTKAVSNLKIEPSQAAALPAWSLPVRDVEIDHDESYSTAENGRVTQGAFQRAPTLGGVVSSELSDDFNVSENQTVTPKPLPYPPLYPATNDAHPVFTRPKYPVTQPATSFFQERLVPPHDPIRTSMRQWNEGTRGVSPRAGTSPHHFQHRGATYNPYVERKDESRRSRLY